MFAAFPALAWTIEPVNLIQLSAARAYQHVARVPRVICYQIPRKKINLPPALLAFEHFHPKEILDRHVFADYDGVGRTKQPLLALFGKSLHNRIKSPFILLSHSFAFITYLDHFADIPFIINDAFNMIK